MTYKPQDGFPYYFDLVKEEALRPLFSSDSVFLFLKSIDEPSANFRYAPDKWSLKQVIGHITDHERIKMFRAFQLSRNEKVELWGYDQNFLVNNAQFDELSLEQLIEDFSCVRKASLSFIDTLSQDQLKIKGKARQHEITLEAFLKTIVGHERHHLKIIRGKYLGE